MSAPVWIENRTAVVMLTGVRAELATPGMMVEVEADAVIHDPDGNVLY